MNLPSFQFNLNTIVPEVERLISHCRATIDQAVAQEAQSWETLVAPIEAADDQLSQYFSPVSHLHSVCNTEPLRAVYEKCLLLLSAYHSEVGQNYPLYQAYQQLADSDSYSALAPAQQKIIANTLRDFRLSGVNLPAPQKKRFTEIQQELTQLGSQFENHVLDATDHWHYHTLEAKELAGLPESTLQAAREKAQQKDRPGYLLGIDFPTYHAVITYADNRTLREQFYQAYQTRASDQGPDAGKWDNTQLIEKILALRQEEAKLLNFDHYATLSLATKMAKSPAEVLTFLTDLAARSKPFALRDLAELTAHAHAHGLSDKLNCWDLS